jgi:serine/threonine protein kinase
LEYCHSQNVIHGDIKPSNILYDGKNVTLIDFEHSVFTNVPDENYVEPEYCGTELYYAPETLANERTPKSDIWAVGTILLEMVVKKLCKLNIVQVYGKNPFLDENQEPNDKLMQEFENMY